MPSWTPEQLRQYEQRGYYENRGKARSPITQPALCNESVAEKAREENHSSRVSVRIVSYRTRLCDPDNLCPKYFIDCLRYAGIIKNDTAKHIVLSVSQERVKSKSEERTEIEVN